MNNYIERHHLESLFPFSDITEQYPQRNLCFESADKTMQIYSMVMFTAEQRQLLLDFFNGKLDYFSFIDSGMHPLLAIQFSSYGYFIEADMPYGIVNGAFWLCIAANIEICLSEKPKYLSDLIAAMLSGPSAMERLLKNDTLDEIDERFPDTPKENKEDFNPYERKYSDEEQYLGSFKRPFYFNRENNKIRDARRELAIGFSHDLPETLQERIIGLLNLIPGYEPFNVKLLKGIMPEAGIYKIGDISIMIYGKEECDENFNIIASNYDRILGLLFGLDSEKPNMFEKEDQ